MTSSPPRQLTLDSLLSLPEAAAAMRITTRHLHTLRTQGRIRTVHLGSRVLVPHREIIRLIDEALTDPPPPAEPCSHQDRSPGRSA